jgi:hypothetical protein
LTAIKGRPTLYSPEIADTILERIASGETLRQLCRSEGMPAESTVRLWVLDDRDGFSARYARARDMQLESWGDETIEISDDGSNDWMLREGKDGETSWVLNGEHVQRSKLRTESRKWIMSRLKPERYGDKLELSGKLDLTHKTDDQLDARIAQLLGQAGAGGAAGGEGAPGETP